MKTKIELEWEKSEKQDMTELINKLQCFRRKWKKSLADYQKERIKSLEKELIRIKKVYFD